VGRPRRRGRSGSAIKERPNATRSAVPAASACSAGSAVNPPDTMNGPGNSGRKSVATDCAAAWAQYDQSSQLQDREIQRGTGGSGELLDVTRGSAGVPRGILMTSTKQRRLLDAYRFPGFCPMDELRGVFGDPNDRTLIAPRARVRGGRSRLSVPHDGYVALSNMRFE
jgi:hypothetical protein